MNAEEFKNRLISAREAKGLSQTKLAELSGMAPTQLARYENGKAVPRRAAMMRLAGALDVSSDWLMKGVTASWPSPIAMQVSAADGATSPEDLIIPMECVDFVRGVAERHGGSVPNAIVDIIKRYMVEITFAPTGHPKIPHLGALVTEYTELELRVADLAAQIEAMKKESGPREKEKPDSPKLSR